jgi:hypothetical protein
MTGTYYDSAHELGAENNSFTPVEDVSEHLKKNRVQDVATESEKLQKREEQLSQSNGIMSQKYRVPDEHLSYSELKDRIREECRRTLPKKERVLLMAKKLEDDLTLKDTICNQICTDLADVTSKRHIRWCLPDRYKQKKRKKDEEESISHLRQIAANVGNNVPEQDTITVDNQGYERPFDEMKGKDVEPASETVKTLQKKLTDVTQERDRVSNENRVLQMKLTDVTHERDSLSVEVSALKEKTQPEMLQEINERFSDKPGLIKGDQLQKVNEAAGKNLV